VEYLRIIDRATGDDFEYPLERERTTLGSSEDNSVVLENAEPFHLEILKMEGGLFKAVDRHTDAGTQINGEWILQKVLAHNDLIDVCGMRLIFNDPSQTQTSLSTSPPSRAGAPGRAPGRPRTVRSKPAAVGSAVSRAPIAPSAPSARTDRPAPSRGPAPAATSGTIPSSPARRKKRSPAIGPILALLFIAICVVGAMFLFKGIESSAEKSSSSLALHQDTFDKAREMREQGFFGPARNMLQVLDTVSDPEVIRLVSEERRQLDRWEELDKMAREKLDDLRQEIGRGSVSDIEADLNHFRATFEQLTYLEPRIAELDQALAKARTIEEEAIAALSSRDVQQRARAHLENRDYATALKLWDRLIPHGEKDRAMEREGRSLIKKRSRSEARKLISQADELRRNGDYSQVLALLPASELARFKGTPLYDNLINKVSEVEELAGLVPHRLMTDDLIADADDADRNGGDRGAGAQRTPPRRPPTGSSSGRQPRKPAAPTETIDRESSSVTAIPESEWHEIDDAVRQWQFDKAISFLEGLKDEAQSREDKNRIATRFVFVHHQMWFLEDLRLALTDDPDRATRVTVKTRDGRFKGKFHSFLNELVYLDTADDLQGFPVEEITPASLVDISKAYPSQDMKKKLNLACFCLNNGLDSEFETLAAVIRKEGTFQRSIDGFLAMDRGTPAAAVDFGYHTVKGRLVAHAEWKEAVLQREIAVLEKKIVSRDAALRNEGYRGFLELGPVSFDVLQSTLERRYRELTAELSAFPEAAKLKGLAELKEQLNRTRDFALELIFDSVRYFYPYNHRQGDYTRVQREVDERVEAVRVLWGDEFRDDIPGPKIKLSKKFLALRDDLNQMALILEDITGGDFKRSTRLGYVNLIPARGRLVHIRNFALDEQEWNTIDASVAILEYNENLECSATRNEREQVKVTNLYRLMMGRRALVINELIQQAARSHSDWMSRTGVFSHFEDTEERKTPGDRMAQAGYDKGSGENIHAGAGSAMGAHQGWYHSSGHHRNLLAPSHTEMATGVVGRYWTQNFGGGSEFTENLLRE